MNGVITNKCRGNNLHKGKNFLKKQLWCSIIWKMHVHRTVSAQLLPLLGLRRRPRPDEWCDAGDIGEERLRRVEATPRDLRKRNSDHLISTAVASYICLVFACLVHRMCAACRSKVKRLIFKLDRNINVETLAKLVGTVFGLGPQRSEKRQKQTQTKQQTSTKTNTKRTINN